jgi:hypothetical protein
MTAAGDIRSLGGGSTRVSIAIQAPSLKKEVHSGARFDADRECGARLPFAAINHIAWIREGGCAGFLKSIAATIDVAAIERRVAAEKAK